MRLFLVNISLLVSSVAVNAQDRAINFDHSSWAEIKAKAAAEKKVIFLDAYTSWCGPCKQMASQVFTNNEVADYFNANFINAKIDMEKGEGPELAKLYKVKAYPSLLFIDAQGKVVSLKVGAQDVKAFLNYGKLSVAGESMESLKAKYKKGDRSYAFMKKYLTRLEGLGENINAVVEEYFSKLPQVKWQTNESWYFISRYIRKDRSPVFKYVLKNQTAYEQKFSAEAVSDYFVMVYRNAIQEAANGIFPTEDVQELKEKIQQMHFAGTALLELECDAAIADRNKDVRAYMDVMEIICSKYPEKDPDTQIFKVGSLCGKMLLQSADPYVLQKATKMAEMSIEIQNPEFMDIYARLLFETGNIDKAIEVEEKVIAILKVKPNTEISLVDCEDRLERFIRKKTNAKSSAGASN